MDCLITYAISINFLSFPISLNSPLERLVLPRSSFGLVQQVTVIVPSGSMTNGMPSSQSLMVRYSRLVLQLHYAIMPLRCLTIEARPKRRISGQFLAEVVLLQASDGKVLESLFCLFQTSFFLGEKQHLYKNLRQVKRRRHMQCSFCTSHLYTGVRYSVQSVLVNCGLGHLS